MILNELTLKSPELNSEEGLKAVADTLDKEFGCPGVTTVAMSLLTNYRGDKETSNYVDNFHQYLRVIRNGSGTPRRSLRTALDHRHR